ncbi:hypothetical protein SCHPADRAFT_979627 [Schizopora paradoxa]|uniref:Uncharacterized protein n=1 Tax=Schizopora paradoxa TaxID=27342 RepID=A0A0H2RCN0_9AGAM|nr:hypothetical protein SCHPADRAFT_979627 [Schizopora paradoxa]
MSEHVVLKSEGFYIHKSVVAQKEVDHTMPTRIRISLPLTLPARIKATVMLWSRKLDGKESVRRGDGLFCHYARLLQAPKYARKTKITAIQRLEARGRIMLEYGVKMYTSFRNISRTFGNPPFKNPVRSTKVENLESQQTDGGKQAKPTEKVKNEALGPENPAAVEQCHRERNG